MTGGTGGVVLGLKSHHKLVKDYYLALSEYSHGGVSHEGALRTAFEGLLCGTARSLGWFLVPNLIKRTADGRVFPDGTVRDQFNLPRGYWEAKDTEDDLDAEIAGKIKQGYPLSNIIFEDTNIGVLFQDREERLRADLHKPHELVGLLAAFFKYAEPDVQTFERAVVEFGEAVPDLAEGLLRKVLAAHAGNAAFKKAFSAFLSLCQESINPSISREAVDEMLIQHLLMERLFGTPGGT